MSPDGKFSYLDFDIYSRRISFFYKNKERMGSTFGFILTSLYAVISIILFLLYFIQTIMREEVSADFSTIYPTEISSISINSDIFYLAFGLEHPTKLIRYIDEGIYYPEVLFIEKVKENGEFIVKSETLLNTERCNIEKFGKDYQHLFDGNELNNSYCLKDFNLTLIGGFKYKKMSIIKINIYPCVNNTKNKNHYKPQDIIDKYLTSTYISFIAKDIGFNPFNYSFPIVPIIQDLYSSIDKSIFKEYIMYFGISQINTDKGLFSTNIKKETFIKYIRDFHSFFFVDSEHSRSGKEIFTAEVRLEDNIYFINRKYTKMAEVFSALGGYMEVISTIFSLIVLLSKKISIGKKLLNSLFNFNLKQKKIILSIEYEKKLFYNFSLEKEKKNRFIHYSARKSIMNKKHRRNSIFLKNNFNNFSPMNQKSEYEQSPYQFSKFQDKRSISANNVIEKGLIGIVRKIPKKKKEENSNIIDQSINLSKNKMLFNDGYQNLNNYQIKRFVEKRGKKENPNFMKDLEQLDKGRRAKLNFNLFDYYCFRKITKKNTEIELFNFGINFYKSQLDIINFFNIMILTQIMLTQQTDKKNNNNILNQTLEMSIKGN